MVAQEDCREQTAPARKVTTPDERVVLQDDWLRRVPPHFSWIDHRLVRADYLRRANAKAWALHLGLVTLRDEHGLSYYGDGTLGRMLSLTDAGNSRPPASSRVKNRCIRCSPWSPPRAWPRRVGRVRDD